jgi:hypothetical protein
MEPGLQNLNPEARESAESVRKIRTGSTIERQGEERLLLALDMFSTGVALMRERIEREHPDLSLEAVAKRVVSGLTDRPLDAPGRLVKGSRNGKSTAT